MTSLKIMARAFHGLALAAVLAAVAPTPSALAQDRGRPDSFADLAERLSPAVVNISTRQQVGETGPQMPDLPPCWR